MSYSVLAIAPIVSTLPALATAAELARIGDLPGVSLTQLTGPVTKQRIIDRLARGSYDAVLWAGHGAPGHLVIEGDTVDPRWLAVQLKQARISLTVLTACQSGNRPAINEFVASFADVLPPAGVSTIVMMVEILDTAAIEYDVALFQALVAGETVRRAHEVGVEAIAHSATMVQAPMLIPADRIAGNVPQAPLGNSLTIPHPIEHRVTALERDVNWLKGIMKPGARLLLARVIFYGLLVIAWSMWMIPEVRDWFLLHPAQAVLITAALLCAALIVRWLPEDDHDQR